MQAGFRHHAGGGVVLRFSREHQLAEGALVPWRLVHLDEVLIFRNTVVFGELEQADQGLEKRAPGMMEIGVYLFIYLALLDN